ncbi:MAG: ABC transporter ATP-binding protein [Williamsia sp.]|nr:ABC transporter ATP-binding protein [Williamsia sp.]
MDLLQVTGIRKRQGETETVQGISFSQPRFQKLALAGETGSGKTTLLRIIAGLVQPDSGEVLLEGKRVEGPAEKLIPGHRRIAYLSQQFELRNNYRVEEVLDYANQLPGSEAAAIFDICRISHLLKRRTDQVSGGEKQRIALARLLVTHPLLLLLDEPYSNLDMIHKGILKSVISDLGEKSGITCLLISHDPLDLLSWADELMVIREGQLIQRGSPVDVYTKPADEYAAALLGKYTRWKKGDSHQPLLLRPEAFRIDREEKGGIPGTIKEIIFMGSYWDIEVIVNGEVATVRSATGEYTRGEKVFVELV